MTIAEAYAKAQMFVREKMKNAETRSLENYGNVSDAYVRGCLEFLLEDSTVNLLLAKEQIAALERQAVGIEA